LLIEAQMADLLSKQGAVIQNGSSAYYPNNTKNRNIICQALLPSPTINHHR